jgi:hypothetical protein
MDERITLFSSLSDSDEESNMLSVSLTARVTVKCDNDDEEPELDLLFLILLAVEIFLFGVKIFVDLVSSSEELDPLELELKCLFVGDLLASRMSSFFSGELLVDAVGTE